MNLRTFCLVIAMGLGVNIPAMAGVMHVYKEDPSAFSWTITIDTTLQDIAAVSGDRLLSLGVTTTVVLEAPADAKIWSPNVLITEGSTGSTDGSLTLRAIHKQDPPHLPDAPSGGSFGETFTVSTDPIVFAADFVELISGSVTHIHNPMNHTDFYKLAYMTTGTATNLNSLVINVTGVHVPVPEPKTLALLLIGLGFLGLRAGYGRSAFRESSRVLS